ncbi:MAG TPA: hypothetical protein DCP63_12985 [Bacteroidetes bacterium]|nr:hypothetical protein [Bacteroidota bacterium]
MNRKTISNIYWGLILIALGIVYLASNLGYLELSWRVYWPMALIVLGLGWIVTSFGSDSKETKKKS